MIKNVFKASFLSLGTSYFISIIYGFLYLGIGMLISGLNGLIAFLGENALNILFFVLFLALLVGAMYLNNHLSYDYAYKKTFNGAFNEKEQRISIVVAFVLQIAIVSLTLGNNSVISWIASMSAYYSIPLCGICSIIFGTEYMGLFVGSILGTVVFYVVRYLSLFEGYRYVMSRSEFLLLEKKKAAIEEMFSGENISKF